MCHPDGKRFFNIIPVIVWLFSDTIGITHSKISPVFIFLRIVGIDTYAPGTIEINVGQQFDIRKVFDRKIIANVADTKT